MDPSSLERRFTNRWLPDFSQDGALPWNEAVAHGTVVAKPRGASLFNSRIALDSSEWSYQLPSPVIDAGIDPDFSDRGPVGPLAYCHARRRTFLADISVPSPLHTPPDFWYSSQCS